MFIFFFFAVFGFATFVAWAYTSLRAGRVTILQFRTETQENSNEGS